VQRGGEYSTPHDGDSSAWFDPIEVTIEPDAIFNAQAAVEVDQVCTTTKKNVLAVIDRGRCVVSRIERV
jgi:hypothetical protein